MKTVPGAVIQHLDQAVPKERPFPRHITVCVCPRI